MRKFLLAILTCIIACKGHSPGKSFLRGVYVYEKDSVKCELVFESDTTVIYNIYWITDSLGQNRTDLPGTVCAYRMKKDSLFIQSLEHEDQVHKNHLTISEVYLIRNKNELAELSSNEGYVKVKETKKPS